MKTTHKYLLLATIFSFGLFVIAAMLTGLARAEAQPLEVVAPTQQWYISTSGDDANSCQDPGTACASVEGVSSKPEFLQGDEILFESGTYQGSGDQVATIEDSASLIGGWNADFSTQIGASVIDGQNIRRGLLITTGVTVTLEQFEIHNGLATMIDSGPLMGVGRYGGGIFNFGTLTVRNSTIANNSATAIDLEPASGGGIYNMGTMHLNNVTVANNSASSGGGISNFGKITIHSSTISNNHVPAFGGGISAFEQVAIENTLISNNTGSYSPDCMGSINSGGYNLIGDSSFCDLMPAPGPGDLSDIETKLWVTNLIGSPGVYPLLIGSPAIDAGNPSGCNDDQGNPLNTDERGVPRVGRCDIGAYEFDILQNPLKQAYLPVVQKPYPGISGRVTINGNPYQGLPLSLRFYNGTDWSTLSTTTTQAGGYYSFTNVPSLGPGQIYYVLFKNDSETSGWLWVWGTRGLTSYSAGSDVTIGNFDIADIALLTPASGTSSALPVIFQWTPRSATPTDSYEFDLYDLADGDPYFYTDPPLGYVGAYGMTGLPPGFKFNVPYVWEVWVYSPDGGYGISYGANWITFAKSARISTGGSIPPVSGKTFTDPVIKR